MVSSERTGSVDGRKASGGEEGSWGVERSLIPAGAESLREMTREEAAEYWSTHELTEDTPGWEEVEEPITFKFKRPLSVVLSLRVDDEHIDRLSELAAARRIGVTTLARELLYEALDREPSNTGGAEMRQYLVSQEQLQELGEAVSAKLLGNMARAMAGQVAETKADYDAKPKGKRKSVNKDG